MTKYEKLIQYALRLVAKKRYTTFEIEKKLRLFVAKFAPRYRGEQQAEDTEELEKALADTHLHKDEVIDAVEFGEDCRYLVTGEYGRDAFRLPRSCGVDLAGIGFEHGEIEKAMGVELDVLSG